MGVFLAQAVTKLNLSYNKIGERGIKQLAEAIGVNQVSDFLYGDFVTFFMYRHW